MPCRSIRFEDCSADSRGQLNPAQCKAQSGCGWKTRAGFSLSIFGPNVTGSVDVTNFTSVGGLGPALQMDAKGAGSAFATFKDCRFSNSALSGSSTAAPTPVVSLADCGDPDCGDPDVKASEICECESLCFAFACACAFVCALPLHTNRKEAAAHRRELHERRRAL